MTTCTECGLPLADDPPPPPTPPPPREHGTASIPIVGMDADQRDLLEMLLRGDDIPTQLTDDAVIVPINHATAAREVVEALDGDRPKASKRSEPLPRTTVANTLRRSPTIAFRWQRLAGWFVDSMLLGIFSRVLADLGLSWWLIGIADGVYWIAATAAWGATLGKLVVGARVSFLGGQSRWTSSFSRWALTGWIGFAAGISADIGLGTASLIGALAIVTGLLTYTPILWDPEGRGLHDRLAGTVVLRQAT